MGNCRSHGSRGPPRRRSDGHRPSDRPVRQWSDERFPRSYRSDDSGDGGRPRRELQSMARVGSRVFRASSLEIDRIAAGVRSEDESDANGHANGHAKGSADGEGNGNHGGGRLREHKASTYEHVHEIVEQGIESCHATNHDLDGTTGKSRRNSREAAGKVGLANLGNTCFMNSSLQCLSNTIPLTDYFLGYDYRGEINYDNFLGTKGALVTSYAELTKHLWLGSEMAYQPTGFKSSLARFAPQFEGYEQQDAQELLAYLLDGIHEDLNRVRSRPYIEDKDCDGTNDEGDAITAWSHYLQRNQSIIVDLFQGQLRNTMKCRNKQSDGGDCCGHINVKFDPFMYLSLPISDKCNSLDDCLDLFCEEELLSGDEQWYCPKCKTHVDATKKIDLFMLPPILIIHLKRFKFDSMGSRSKIDRSVSYPLSSWNLSRAKKSEGGIYPLYDLYAVSHHRGNVGFGHYTAHAKNRFDGEWYDFNDSQCRAIDPTREGLGGGSSAYCLFYNRVERVSLRRGDGEAVTQKTVIRRQSISRPELWPHLQRAKAAEWKSVRPESFAMEDDANGSKPELAGVTE